jgi:ubiquinone/menaquinone biosynthesis C-methylase UbiE
MTRTAIIHASATTGFADATSYDTHRPSYPPEAVEKLLAHVGLAGDGHAGARIIDLAAGTGKLTELLAARPEGYEVLAVEPHDGMRGTLEAKKLRGVTSRSGTATDIAGVEDEWANVVVAAQVGVFLSLACPVLVMDERLFAS